MSVHHVCSACRELKPLAPLELKILMVMTCHVGASSQTGSPGNAASALNRAISPALELKQLNAWCFKAWLLILNFSTASEKLQVVLE